MRTREAIEADQAKAHAGCLQLEVLLDIRALLLEEKEHALDGADEPTREAWKRVARAVRDRFEACDTTFRPARPEDIRTWVLEALAEEGRR